MYGDVACHGEIPLRPYTLPLVFAVKMWTDVVTPPRVQYTLWR